MSNAAYMREWRKRNPRSEYKSRLNYKRTHRKQVLAASQRSWNKHPERRRARHAVSNALRDGRLIRPNRCSECSSICIPESHHKNYAKPLEVIWLCRSCHLAIEGCTVRIPDAPRAFHVPHVLPSRRRNTRNTSGFKGVSWNSQNKKWKASITISNLRVFLGLFSDAKEAGRAYDKHARERLGKLARLNFPEANELSA
jgi:hypothetical protein